jgi:hypothetical protein
MSQSSVSGPEFFNLSRDQSIQGMKGAGDSPGRRCGGCLRWHRCRVQQREARFADAVHTCFGDDEVHRHVVSLRVDRRQARDFEADPDLERLWAHLGKCAIEVAAAIAQAVAVRVESDRRNEEHLWCKHLGAVRHRQAERSFHSRRTGPPFEEPP